MVFTALIANNSTASNLNSVGDNTKPNTEWGMSLVRTIEQLNLPVVSFVNMAVLNVALIRQEAVFFVYLRNDEEKRPRNSIGSNMEVHEMRTFKNVEQSLHQNSFDELDIST